MDLVQQIKSFFRGEVESNDATLKKYSVDASLFEIRPRLVVYPADADDLKKLVKFINLNPQENLSLTPRSAGTDMTGAAIGDSIVIDFTRHINGIGEVGLDFAVAEPGVYYRDFEKETLKRGLILPTYPASREICALGGIIANNSGGEKTLAYGKTADYVKELKVILNDGNLYEVRPLAKTELEHKMSESSFEGEVYKKTFKLISENLEIIRNAKPKVSKNSAGYMLWDVWDGETFDLTRLFCGSQGTLGLVTEATLKLVKPKPYSKMLVIFMRDLEPLTETILRLLEFRPESLESFDDSTLKLALRYLPGLIKLIKPKNIFSLAWKFLPEFWMVLSGGLPKLIVLAEFTGDTEIEALKKAERAKNSLKNLRLKSHVVKTDEEARKYWVMRRESFNLLREHIKNKRTAPFIDDIVVRPEKLPEFLPKLREILSQYKKLQYTTAGHLGDGNFHIIPLMDMSDPENREIIPELSKKVYDLVIKFEGSITGEHNDGLIRGPYLRQMYGDKIYKLFEEVKNIFDPRNIFNPGKKIGVDPGYVLSHMKRKN